MTYNMKIRVQFLYLGSLPWIPKTQQVEVEDQFHAAAALLRGKERLILFAFWIRETSLLLLE
jgi:hypothetical protein